MRSNLHPHNPRSKGLAKDRRSQRGFTLVEMMVGLAVGTFGVFIFSSAVLKSRTSAMNIEFASARSELSLKIRKNILDRRALAFTAQNNPVLKAVVENDYSGPVTTVQSHVLYGLDLYDVLGNKIAGPDADATHPVPVPVYYTMDGVPCTNFGTSGCYISVTSSFSIQGHPRMGTYHNIEPTAQYPSWNSTLRPEFLQINYAIEYDAAAPGVLRKPMSGSVFLSIDDLGF